MCLALAPKKFFCYYTLRVGALCIGIFMCVVFSCTSIASVVQSERMVACDDCPHYTGLHARSSSVTYTLFNIAMLFVNFWFIFCGVIQERKSVVLAWLMITAVWLMQTCFLLLVLIGLFAKTSTPVIWIICLSLGIAAIGVLVYATLVVLGFWLELKHKIVVSVSVPN